jgi:hypothetical protein
MARLKRLSPVYDVAITRKAGISSIGATLDLGAGLTLTGYQSAIDAVKTSLDDYNNTLSIADQKLNLLKEQELVLKNLNERMLIAVAARYGKDSNEYEMAGETKKSERKRGVKKVKPTI